MPDRKTPIPLLWLASLLAGLPVASTWTPGTDSNSCRPRCALVDGAPASGPLTAAVDAALPVDDNPQVNALPSEGEEQDQVDAPAEGQVSFQPRCSFRTVADRRLTVPRPIPSLYPLRC